MPDSKDAVFNIENFEEALKRGKTEEEVVNKTTPEKTAENDTESEPEEVKENKEKEVETEKTDEEKEDEAVSANEEKEDEEDKDNEVEVKNTKSKRDTNAESRIAKLVKERERLKGQLDAIRYQARTVQQEKVQEVLIDPDAPNPLNYTNGVNDIDYKVDLKLHQRDKIEKHKVFQKTQQEIIKKYPDTKELLEMDAERNASGIKTVNATTINLIMESEVSGELWHYLLANSDEALEIANMDPIKTAKYIGKIEAKLENENKEDVKVETSKPTKKQLPPPLTPVKTTKGNTTVKVNNFGFTAY